MSKFGDELSCEGLARDLTYETHSFESVEIEKKEHAMGRRRDRRRTTATHPKTEFRTPVRDVVDVGFVCSLFLG